MMHALLTDLDQIQDASDNMKFSRNVLDHSDHLLLLSDNCTAVLSNILLLQDISILPSEYFVMADLLRAVAGEDSDSDGEAGVDHDEEDAHLEKEPADRKVEDADVKKKCSNLSIKAGSGLDLSTRCILAFSPSRTAIVPQLFVTALTTFFFALNNSQTALH